MNFNNVFISSPHSSAFRPLVCTTGAAPRALNQTHDLASAGFSKCVMCGSVTAATKTTTTCFLPFQVTLSCSSTAEVVGCYMFFVTKRFSRDVKMCKCSTESLFCLPLSTAPLNQDHRKREAPYQGTANSASTVFKPRRRDF